ncbi:MAG: A/G-specific adenine glycosylase [Thermoleophilia bacterium]
MPSPAGVGSAAAVDRLLEWFATDGADFPWRRTRDRYAVLVAEVQLQATQAARVVPFYREWMRRWPTVEALAGASLGEVLRVWQGLGYPRRARHLHDAARRIVAEGWPAPERLTDLPGVGTYTAAALRCFADEEAVIPVDTNVARIMARRFPDGWPGTPDGRGWAVGQALMDLGRLHCTARAPSCDSGCPLRDGCPAADSGTVAEVTPKLRPQGRYQGSLRQRRGLLLAALADAGRVAVDQDPDAAASLVQDGLAVRRDDDLVPVP